MITVNKANPTPGEVTSSLTGSSGDGSGLHFDGSAGAISLGSSMPDLGTKYSLEFIVKGDARTGETYLLDAYNSSSTKRLTFVWTVSGNIQLNINTSSTASFIATPDNGEVVHLLLSVDGTSATLYKNGNSVSTKTVVANALSGATSSHIGASQDGSANRFNGTIYRTRFWNHALSSTEVQTAFERADVDFADQYGEQNLVDAAASAFTSGVYNWVAYGTNGVANVSNNLVITYADNASGAYVYLRDSTDLNQNLVVGKKYRLRITAKYAGGSSGPRFTVNTQDGLAHGTTLTTSFAEDVIEFTAHHATNVFVSLESSMGTSNVVTIDSWQVDEIGCVSDYQTSAANPLQSLTVQDASGAADGTCSASGVTQVQPVVQLNSTSARIGTTAATPADGEVVATSVKAETYRSARSDGDVYIQAATASDFVAIGTQVSSNILKVDGSGNVTVNGGDLKLKAPAGNQTDAELLFSSPNNSAYGSTFAIDSKILSTANQTDNAYGSKLKFYTSDNSDTVTERATIDSSGNVQIGTGSLAAVGSGPTLGLVGAAPEITLRDSATGTPYAVMRTNDNGNLILEADSGDNAGSSGIEFKVDGATKATIASSGIGYFDVGGINLGNETLSVYRKGTFAPGLYYQNGSGVTIGGTAYASHGDSDYIKQVGQYVKVGNVVHVQIFIEAAIAGSIPNDNFGVQGLPFTSQNVTDDRCLLNAYTNGGGSVNHAMVSANSTVAVFETINGSGNLADDVGTGSNIRIHISGTYITS